MKQSPRVSRFSNTWSDDQLDCLIEQPAVPIDLGKGEVMDDADSFRIAAQKIFLSDPQIRRILRQLMALGLAHAKSHFATDTEYLRHLYDYFPWGDEHPPTICFSGLAGTGKSKCLSVFSKLVESDSLIDVSGIEGLPLVATWLLTLADGVGLNAILLPRLRGQSSADGCGDNQSYSSTEKSINLPQLLKLARIRAWRDAVCFLILDEFQNISKGSKSAKATTILIQLRTVGPRLAYCANFSLVHKLMEGAPEDRRRLLAHPIEMLPDRNGSRAFFRYLEEIKKIAPAVFVFDVGTIQSDIHDFTFGVKGYVVELLKWAYVASREKGKSGKVDLIEIKRAYLSREYSSCRKDVEILWRQTVEARCVEPDLWSPFRQPGDDFWAEDAARQPSKSQRKSNVIEATAAIEQHERRVSCALIEEAMPPNQALQERKLRNGSSPKPPLAPLIRLSRKHVSLQDLYDGANAIDKL